MAPPHEAYPQAVTCSVRVRDDTNTTRLGKGCDDVSNPRRANGTRRDKLRRRVLREESNCHLCGQAVDVRLTHGLPGSPEVDELVPVTYGGNPFDRANCRLAHRYCNRLRWHGPIALAQQRLTANPPRFAGDGRLLDTTPQPVTSRRW